MKLELESERFSASGGIDGRAARRAMGKPGVQFWELFLRETLQNSWDAKLENAQKIDFSVSAVKFDEAQRLMLSDVVFADVPATLRDFRKSLGKPGASALMVIDQHTRGLGGVTRADLAPVEGEPREFVEFIRDIGRASSKVLGGGTYGFGKSVLFDASSISTCIVYSQTRVNGRVQNRLVATAVAEQFADRGKRFTGRHWWGEPTDESYVDPISGDVAREIAAQLGMAALEPNETGTTIAVLNPVLETDETSLDVIGKIADAALTWAWPHMVDLGTGASIDFKFTADGAVVEIADPASDPVLQNFVRAYEQASIAEARASTERQWPWTVERIEVRRPTRRVAGVLAYRKYALPEIDRSRSRHIALMRDPRFVVKYLEVAEDPSGQAIAGVFVVDPAANNEFAKSEPVAHDDWVPNEDAPGRVSLVRVALREIRERFRSQSIGQAEGSGNENASGVSQVSKLLGTVLSGLGGAGVEAQRRKVSPRRGSGGGKTKRTSVIVEQYPRLSFESGEVFADFAFSFATTEGVRRSDYELTARPLVVLDGGAVESEEDRPLGAVVPEVVGWWSSGKQVSSRQEVPASMIDDEHTFVRIRQPRGTAVTVSISARAIE